MRLEFEQRMSGPLALGAARFVGLGVLAAVGDRAGTAAAGGLPGL